MVNKLKKDDSTEQKVLVAAKKVFVARGMAGARMQDIADAAGINKAMLHYYFRNKEQLFDTIFSELASAFFPQIQLIFESDESLFLKIESFCSAYIDKILLNPYIPQFVLNEINQRPDLFIHKLSKIGPPDLTKLLAQIDAEIKAGKIKPIAPVQLIVNMLSMCIFPFIAKPMLMAVMNIDEGSFTMLMESRKKAIPQFIIESIKK